MTTLLAAIALTQAAMQHRCDDGRSVAQVLAYARQATGGHFRTEPARLEAFPWGPIPRVELPVVLNGNRSQDRIEGTLRFTAAAAGRITATQPLARLVQLGARPFAFYAAKLCGFGSLDPAGLTCLPRPGGRTVQAVVAEAGCEIVGADLTYAYMPDTYALQTVVHLRIDRRHREHPVCPCELTTWSDPYRLPHDTTCVMATWYGEAAGQPMQPAWGFAEAIASGHIGRFALWFAGLG